jgi:hypothetical protein
MNANSASFEHEHPAALQERASQQAGTKPTRPPGNRLFWLLRTFGWLLLLGFSLGVMVQLTAMSGQKSNDFCQDYIAAVRVLQGIPPYLPLRDWPDFHTCVVPLNYDSHPPFSVLVVLPLGLLPKTAASVIWAFLSVALYLASGVLLLKILGWWSLRGAALFAMCSIFWPPVGGSTEAQNFAQLLTFLLAAAWFLERKGKRGWAGAVLGLAALVKIWPLALFLNAVLQRRWRAVLAGGLTILAGTLVTLVLLGSSAYAAYLGPVRLEETPEVPHEVNVSLVGALARPWAGFSNPPAIIFPRLLSGLSVSQAVLLGEGVAALLILGTLALVVWGLRRAQGEAMETLCQGLLVTVLLLGFPITWNWGLITLLLPLATTVLALRSLPRPPRWWCVMLGCGLVLLVNPEWLPFLVAHQNPIAGNIIFSLPTLGLLLFALAQAQLLFWAARPRSVQAIEKPLASA